jgi:solute carrier family 44 (choline transporter-like protein), member 2/4/5
MLLVRNCLRVVALDIVTDVVLLIGKLVVVGGIAALSYFVFSGFFTEISFWVPKLNYFWVPMIILIIVSYIVANVFFTVYEMGVDTMFLCFLEDLEMNDGSPEKPYFMSKDLREILHRKNYAPEKADEDETKYERLSG